MTDVKDFQAEVNTIGSLLPTNSPFITAQVSKAVEMLLVGERVDVVERNLKIAIQMAEYAKKYSQGELLYNYRPIIIALLLNTNPNLDNFDTLSHEVPVTFAIVQQFVDSFATQTKSATSKIIELFKQGNLDAITVIFANLLADMKDNKNVLNVAYLMTNLNASGVQFVDANFLQYSDILAEINERQF